MGGIFLSYRREDSAGYSGRLADSLRDNFGEAVIFRDVDAITPGIDFVQAITTAVEEADVMLAVIGRRWLIAKDGQRRRRIDDPDDYVRLEITTALERGRKVFPVLVDGAQMPTPEEVPEPIRPFLRRQASELTDSRWNYDLGVLVEQLRPSLVVAATQTIPVKDDEAPATGLGRRPRLRLVLVGLVAAVLVGSVLVATRSGSSPDHPVTPATSVTTGLPSSTVPETTSTVPVATTIGVRPTSPTIKPTVAPPRPTTGPTSPPVTPSPTTMPATTVPVAPVFPYVLRSGDGTFGAHPTLNGLHYIVRRIATGDVVFTTQPQFASDPGDANNDVKAGKFCSASNMFAATYHYWGGTSIYSWIGYWSTATGQLVQNRRVEGEVYVLDPYC